MGNLLIYSAAEIFSVWQRARPRHRPCRALVKNRAPLPNSWRWEIYRAGRSSPIEQSSIYFHSVATANRAGKEALRQLLDKLKV